MLSPAVEVEASLPGSRIGAIGGIVGVSHQRVQQIIKIKSIHARQHRGTTAGPGAPRFATGPWGEPGNGGRLPQVASWLLTGSHRCRSQLALVQRASLRRRSVVPGRVRVLAGDVVDGG